MSTYTPTVFDKAFTRAMEYLKNNKLTTYAKFAGESGLDKTVLSNILRKERGVPQHKMDLVIHILVSKYGIRQNFLKHNTGSISAKDSTAKQSDGDDQIENLKARIQELEYENQTLQQLVDSQSKVIETFMKKK